MADPLDALSAIVVRPDDLLVIRVSPKTSRQQFDEFKARLDKALEEHRLDSSRVLVVAAEQIGVVRN